MRRIINCKWLARLARPWTYNSYTFMFSIVYSSKDSKKNEKYIIDIGIITPEIISVEFGLEKKKIIWRGLNFSPRSNTFVFTLSQIVFICYWATIYRIMRPPLYLYTILIKYKIRSACFNYYFGLVISLFRRRNTSI